MHGGGERRPTPPRPITLEWRRPRRHVFETDSVQPVSGSSLEAANWSRLPEWQLNTVAALLPRSDTDGPVELAQETRRVSSDVSASFGGFRHHRPQEVGQLTRNNYKHLLPTSWKTNGTSKLSAFSACEAKTRAFPVRFESFRVRFRRSGSFVSDPTLKV